MPLPNARRWSLATLLLLVTAAASVLGTIAVYRGKARAVAEAESWRREALTLRKELGLLAVDDPAKAYALRVETDETRNNPKRWRLRLHLPELPDDADYWLYSCVGKLPPDGLHPRWDYAYHEPGGCRVKPGEYTLDLTLVPPREDGRDWLLQYEFLGGTRFVGSRPRSYNNLDGDMSWIITGPHITTSETATPGFQTEHDPLEPITLLRFQKGDHRREEGEDGGPVSRVFSLDRSKSWPARETLLVWIEPYADNARPRPSGPSGAAYLRRMAPQTTRE